MKWSSCAGGGPAHTHAIGRGGAMTRVSGRSTAATDAHAAGKPDSNYYQNDLTEEVLAYSPQPTRLCLVYAS